MRLNGFRNLFYAVIVSALLAGCASLHWNSPKSAKELVLDQDFPDPAILRASDGYYYAYGTQTARPDGSMINLQVARSKDLKHWESLGEGLPRKPVWASKTQKIWAPHVSEHQGRYILHYSADPNELTGLCLAVATATSPAGPFADQGKPLRCGKSFVNIDPMVFEDKKSNEAFLIWGSGFEPLKIQKLSEDHLQFAPKSSPVEILSPVPNKDPANYQRLVEGSWLLEHEGWYYLFFSGDNCCEPTPHYAVMVARSRNLQGPYENFSGGAGPTHNALVVEDESWLAPGHNSVIEDSEGHAWIFYHAIDRKNQYLKSVIPGDRAVRRVLVRSRLEFKDGWPKLLNGEP